MRKLFVNVLALLVVVLLAGVSLAGTEPIPTDDELGLPATASAAVGAQQEPGEEAEADADEDGSGFGAIRSAEVQKFGECMAAAGEDREAKNACRELKPGPAHLHPEHPGKGHMFGHGAASLSGAAPGRSGDAPGPSAGISPGQSAGISPGQSAGTSPGQSAGISPGRSGEAPGQVGKPAKGERGNGRP